MYLQNGIAARSITIELESGGDTFAAEPHISHTIYSYVFG